MDQAPDLIDHTVLAMDLTDDAVLTIVMRDVGESLVPPGDATVPAAQHARFIAHMAALSQRVLGMGGSARPDHYGGADALLRAGQHRGRAGRRGGARTAGGRRGRMARPGRTVAVAVRHRPVRPRRPRRSSPPACPACRARSCTATGRWATWAATSDGRTVLLDWTLPGAGPACWDLCWYLALNRARLPEQKEAAISRFRAALERHGIATAAWWQEQLDLCLIGVMATFGWEKALGDAGELSWWEARVADAVARQHIPLPRVRR